MENSTMVSIVKQEIDESGLTNSQIINGLDMYPGTYYDIWKKNRLDILKFVDIAVLLGRHPVDFFNTVYSKSNNVDRFELSFDVIEGKNSETKSNKKEETREIEFLRKQNEQLTKIINNLTMKD